MNNQQLDIKLNNIIYECILEKKYYNLKDKKAVAINVMKIVVPVSEVQLRVDSQTAFVCEDCYKNNIGEGLHFEDPSPILKPEFKPDSKMMEDLNGNKK